MGMGSACVRLDGFEAGDGGEMLLIEGVEGGVEGDRKLPDQGVEQSKIMAEMTIGKDK